jgi:hypothetical protein
MIHTKKYRSINGHTWLKIEKGILTSVVDGEVNVIVGEGCG